MKLIENVKYFEAVCSEINAMNLLSYLVQLFYKLYNNLVLSRNKCNEIL